MGRHPRLLLGVCLLLFARGTAQAAPATVAHLTGEVNARAGNSAEWTNVGPGQKMDEGTSVRTGENGQVDLVTARGHRFHLKSNTLLSLSTLAKDNTATHLEKGSVISTVEKLKSNERFSLDTPTAVCAVRGTQFETVAGERGTMVSVYRGIVGVSLVGEATAETAIHAGQMTAIHDGRIEVPRAIPQGANAERESALARTARHEVGLDMTRTEVIASAALERRFADYQEGKSAIDASGRRVRIEEYIVRPAPDQFKLVALDERGSQLAYFFYQGTFNKPLPTDLSIALRDLSGTLGSAPNYYLKSYEMGQSNTQDSVHDTAAGGHLVQITMDGSGNFTLTDPTNPGNTRAITGAQLQGDGSYKVYDPISDSFRTVTAAQLASSTHFGIYIPENDTFHDLAPGDNLWRTRFDNYEHDINNLAKIQYVASSANHVLATGLDATYTYAGHSVSSTVTPDPNNVDATITNLYGDGTFESYRTVLVDDRGAIAPLSAFDSISTGAAYKNELLKWNYEQQVSATEFQGRKIDLVVEPRIFIESGLIQ